MSRSGDIMTLEFRRHALVEDALVHAQKKKFDPAKAIKVIPIPASQILTNYITFR